MTSTAEVRAAPRTSTSPRGTSVAVLLPAEVDPALLGGKGASLLSLVDAGLPVPRTAVITTEAYCRVASGGELGDLLNRLRTGPLPSPAEAEEAAAAVDRAFLEAELPPGLEQELLAQTRDVWGAGPVAVRSSATTEDLHGASFAGQYRSFLGVSGGDAVLRAVRLTWASLWHPSPRSYRRFQGISEADVAMAVIVMRMVDATTSGVAFTIDPAGTPGALRIEVVHGLAEKLVSGQVTPRAFVTSRSGPRPELARAPAELVQVADLALSIEALCDGEPQDVEWAYDGSATWVVQARPITVLATGPDDDGFDSPLSPDDVSTTAGIAEMLPGVLPPLVWEMDSLLVEEAFRRMFGELDALPDRLVGPACFLRRVRGRAVLDLQVLKAVAAGLPGGSAAEVERQYFGAPAAPADDAGPPPAGRRPSPLRRLIHETRVVRLRRTALSEGEVVQRAVDLLLSDPPVLGSLTASELLGYRARLLDLALRAMAAEVSVAASAVSSYNALELALGKHLGAERGALRTQELTARAGAEALRRRRDRLPRVPEELRGVLERDWRSAERLLQGSEAGRVLLAQLHTSWGRAGSTSVFGGPTWSETPALGWAWLQSAAPRAGAPTVAASQAVLQDCVRELQALDGWRLRRVLTGQVVDVRVSLLARQARLTVDLLSSRELVKAAVLALGGEVRRVHLELGGRLVALGRLEVPSDVDHLVLRELRAALAGAGPSLAEIGKRRRWLERMGATAALPQVFTGRPPPPRAVVRSGTRFTGWGASPGTWTGRAAVLASPGAAPVARGDVLVAHTTDASWAPLFLVAGAVVVEEGGPLSHASIVARELRLPAVLNVPGIVERLRSAPGAVVTVDGDAGTVVLHEAPVDEEVAP